MANFGPFVPSLRCPFRFVLQNLLRAPNDRQTLAALDSVLLPSAHLLDPTSSLLLIRCLSASRKLTRAASLLSALRRPGAISEQFLYSVVWQCLVPRGTTRDVQSFWGDLVARLQQGRDADHKQQQRRPSDASASSFVIHLCRHCDEDDAVVEIELAYRWISASGWPLSRQCYMALVGAFCQKRNPNPSLAVEVLREMEEKGFEVDELTYFVLFRCFCRAGRVSEADSIMRSVAERWKYELDVSLYEEFLRGLCKSGKLREARKLFDKLAKGNTGEDKSAPRVKLGRRVIFQLHPLQKVPESMAFEMYFKALCSAGKADEAERLLAEARQNNALLDNCVYSSFLEVLFQVGRSEDAIEFFRIEREKQNAAAVGDIAVPVVVGLCRMGRVDDGYRLLLEMEDGGFLPTAHVWNEILKSYWKQGRAKEAMYLFESMQVHTVGGNVKINGSTYSTMIYGYLAKGDMKMAVNLVEDMARMNMRADVHLHKAVVRSLYAFGEHEEAQKYLNRMIETGILASYTRWQKLVDTIASIRDDTFMTEIN